VSAEKGTPRASAAAQRELVCIACPLGCRMVVSTDAGGEVTVTGNRCPRGEAYGKEEILSPKRILTAVVPTDSAQFPFAPVRTSRSISRELMQALLSDLYGRRVSLPVREGQVLIEDYDGARVVFTRTLPPDEISPVGQAGAEPERQDQVPGL
jgi:CxxC motif-containing protein